ncbi:MAG TPA: penicillin acylase family protein, partial [Dehalococcoidia bacterium]|nr:penicillin acylase family protein [Dehalococcoidia bacterium]
EFRERFRNWPGPSLNMVYADTTGRIGWQLTGQAPVRRKGHGALPLAGWVAGAGWEEDLVPFESMPFRDGAAGGFVATANGRPVAAGDGVFLGEDWLDGYRFARIAEALESRRDWGVSSIQALQLDTVSLPWREMRETVLSAEPGGADGRTALNLLRDWDGIVGATSPAAAVFELFMTQMIRRAVAAKAPNSVEIALARGFTPLQPQTPLGLRRASYLVRLLREQPEGWFANGWSREVGLALGAAMAALRRSHGDDPAGWQWGRVRPLTLRHPISIRRPLGRIFNLGPIPCGGDTNTIAQAGVDPLEPTANPGAVAALRMVIDVGDWDRSRFALPGGQSGNPLSPHYADQLKFWRIGKGVPIAWSEAAVRRAVRETLRLERVTLYAE